MRLYIFKELIKIHKLVSDPSAFVWGSGWNSCHISILTWTMSINEGLQRWLISPECSLPKHHQQSSDSSIQGTSWTSCTCQDHSSKVDRVRKITGTSWFYSSGEIKIPGSGRDPTSKKWMENGHREHKILSSGLCICTGMQTHATMNMYIGLHRCADIDRNHRKTTF